MDSTQFEKRTQSMPVVFVGDRKYRVEAFNPRRLEARLISPVGIRITQSFSAISVTPPIKVKDSL